MATCPRKFSDAQVSLLELEFNSGLCSTSLKKFGDRITTLAKRTGLRESDVQCWINNRKCGPAPSCFPSESGEEIGQQPTKGLFLQQKLKDDRLVIIYSLGTSFLMVSFIFKLISKVEMHFLNKQPLPFGLNEKGWHLKFS
eukprot:gene10189-11236_t